MGFPQGSELISCETLAYYFNLNITLMFLLCVMSLCHVSLCRCRIFSHPNILPVLGACQSPPSPHPIIITHYMPYGSLYNILHQGTSKLLEAAWL